MAQASDLLQRVADLAQSQREDLKLLDTHLALLTRRVFLAAVLGYLLFGAICAGGAFLYIESMRSQTRRLLLSKGQRIADLKHRIKALEERQQALDKMREKHQTTILEYFQAFSAGKVTQALELESKAREAAHDAFEQAVVDYSSNRLHELAAQRALAKGLSALQAGKLKRAVRELGEAATYAGNTQIAVQAHYYAGLAYYKLGQFARAAEHLGMVVASKNGADVLDDTALFRLGHAHDMLKHVAAAARYYRLLIERFPKSPLAAVAKAKLKKLPTGH